MRVRLAVLLAVCLTGCSSKQWVETQDSPARDVYLQRAGTVSAWLRWGLSGRLSVDDGRDGGGGRLDWQVKGPDSLLDFRGALGRGAWRLEIGRDEAQLSKADGTVVSAATVDELVEYEIGWQIPLEFLQWWVRGLVAPGYEYSLNLDENGLLLRLEQQGWVIEIDRYMEYGGVMLPRRLQAVNGDYRVKLAVSRWWHAEQG